MNLAALEVLYFGCKGVPGHDLQNRWGSIRLEQTPWGESLDSGLCPKPEIVNGLASYHRKGGWTAISFWDRSGDSRPGSNSAFVVNAEISPTDLLVLARLQWPEIFSRSGFPHVTVPI